MDLVIVAVDDKYNDNNGAYQIAWAWDGEAVQTMGGVYDPNVYRVNATEAEIKAASDWLRDNTEPTIPRNKYAYGGRGSRTYIGCVVKLKRSRKAPNGKELTVVDFYESYYCSRYNQNVPERIKVTDGNEWWVVSSGCIDQVVKGVIELPFWVR